MDPLSVTLGVVTLATAVKDLVELGQKIHESFSKVSRNLRNAQHVAKEIKEMAEEIKVFYEAHKDLLDSMKDFGVALEGLLDKFQNFEVSILPLLPQTDRRGPGLFLRGWWNNNKIEGRISDLESDIVRVMRRYMMSGVMRNEVKLERVYQGTSRGFTDVQEGMTQGFEVIRRDISALHVPAANALTRRSYDSSGTTSDEFNRNVIMFAQSTASTSVPMLRTPNVITEELMTAAYIKLQINSIAMTVEKMSTLPASALNNVTLNRVAPFNTIPAVEEASMSITHLRHHVVRQVTNIRDLLENERIETLSIHDGACLLSILSTGLKTLDMGHESTQVGKWAITLARLLADASGGEDSDLTASLAHNLLNQSNRYYDTANMIQSLQAVKEAYTISENLRNHDSGNAHYQILYSDILLRYATLVDNQQSIEMCLEAVQILENILHIQAFTQSTPHGKIEMVVQPNSLFLDNLFSSAPPITAIRSFAHALQQLGTSLAIDNQPKSALGCAFLAIAVRRKMASIHGHKHKVDLARALLSLAQSAIASCIPADELVDMAEECIQLFRELVGINTQPYARLLVYVLLAKASALANLRRDSEAIATWEEAAVISGQIVQDSKLCATALGDLSDQFRRLERHDDAARTGRLAIDTYHEEAETRAWRYFFLSRDLQDLRRYKESAEAARNSVTLYRHLAMQDPATWMGDLTRGLSDLAHCLAASGDYSEAMVAWKESLSILDRFLNSGPEATSDAINVCLTALQGYTFICYALEDEEKCLEVGLSAIRYLRQLSEIHSHQTDSLMRAEYWYAYNMLRLGRLQDAQQYIDHWNNIWSIKPEVMPDAIITTWHARMMKLKADVLESQGCTKQALLVTQKGHNILGAFITTSGYSFDEKIESMVREAQLRANLGESEEAMQAAEGALRLSRDNKLEPIIDSFLWSLYGIALTMLSCHNYDRAVETAREGCNFFASPDGLEFWEDSEYNSFLRPSLLAILSSAEANLGRYSTALEYAHRAVDASLEIREMKAWVSATTAEHSYMEARGNLADILLATGDLAQARQICEERSVYFSQRVEKRMGEYRDLAPILRMLGVLCCSEGRHEEGEAAAKELSRIIKTLGAAFPSLLEQVKIRLLRQTKVPILKVLDNMCQKLDCKHQIGVTALFEI